MTCVTFPASQYEAINRPDDGRRGLTLSGVCAHDTNPVNAHPVHMHSTLLGWPTGRHFRLKHSMSAPSDRDAIRRPLHAPPSAFEVLELQSPHVPRLLPAEIQVPGHRVPPVEPQQQLVVGLVLRRGGLRENDLRARLGPRPVRVRTVDRGGLVVAQHHRLDLDPARPRRGQDEHPADPVHQRVVPGPAAPARAAGASSLAAPRGCSASAPPRRGTRTPPRRSGGSPRPCAPRPSPPGTPTSGRSSPAGRARAPPRSPSPRSACTSATGRRRPSASRSPRQARVGPPRQVRPPRRAAPPAGTARRSTTAAAPRIRPPAPTITRRSASEGDASSSSNTAPPTRSGSPARSLSSGADPAERRRLVPHAPVGRPRRPPDPQARRVHPVGDAVDPHRPRRGRARHAAVELRDRRGRSQVGPRLRGRAAGLPDGVPRAGPDGDDADHHPHLDQVHGERP